MKIMIIIFIFIIAIVFGFLAINFFSKPVSKAEVIKLISELIKKEVSKNKNVNAGIVYLKSEKYEIEEVFAAGTVKEKIIKADQPFHSASVGKAFTATLVAYLAEKGSLSFDDKASSYLKTEILSDLFVIEGTDYSKDVTIRQLLNHTSGAADYFDDKADGEAPLKELIPSSPERLWSPMDLIDYSRKYQKPVGIPGEKYHYSDSGYILLGLIIEKASGKSFHEYLNEIILTPLKMDDSYLMFYSEPKNEKRIVADVMFDGVDISRYNSLSIDWSGGGIVSTVYDLSIFIEALNKGEIIGMQTLDELYSFDYKFMNGIHYGLGFMEYHFKEYFPTLGSLPMMRGHMGVLGTQMLYDTDTGTTFICSFGSTDYSGGSVKTMIKILSMIDADTGLICTMEVL